MASARNMRDYGDRSDAEPRIAAVVRLAGDEPLIGRVLGSVAWASHRLAVNLGSTDATLHACEANGVTLVDEDALPEETERRGLDWLLLIDGHEQVPLALAREIRGEVSAGGSSPIVVAYRIERRVRFLGRTLRSHSWKAAGRVRLARRDAISWPRVSLATDSLPVEGVVRRLATPLAAEPCINLRDYISRMDVLTNAAALADHRARVPVRWVDLALRPARHGLRALPGAAAKDGMAGVILAVLEAYSLAVAAAKRWELENVGEPRAQV